MELDQRQQTLNTLIDESITTRLKEVHTCLPGIIQKFDVNTQRAEIQPAIKRIVKNTGEELALPRLINCPIGKMQAGGFVITFPVKPGDECMLHFTERSLDSWLRFGEERKPNDIRMHHESDAYFLPVGTSQKTTISNYSSNNLEIRSEDGAVKMSLTPSGDVTVDANALTFNGPVTINDDLQVNGAVDVTGNVTAADFIAGLIRLLTHRHLGVTTGGGISQGPTV